jgi:hypothetical protein
MSSWHSNHIKHLSCFSKHGWMVLSVSAADSSSIRNTWALAHTALLNKQAAQCADSAAAAVL